VRTLCIRSLCLAQGLCVMSLSLTKSAIRVESTQGLSHVSLAYDQGRPGRILSFFLIDWGVVADHDKALFMSSRRDAEPS